MNKYMMLALLPILFQSALYCADLNKELQQQLISARRAMNRNVKLELDPILQALVSFSQEGKTQKNVAILRIKVIKMALEKYRSKQDLSWVSWLRGATPQVVKNQIDPALAKVNKVLAIVTKWTASDYAWAGGITLALAALVPIVPLLLSNKKTTDQAADEESRHDSVQDLVDAAAVKAAYDAAATDEAAADQFETDRPIREAKLADSKAKKRAAAVQRAAEEAAVEAERSAVLAAQQVRAIVAERAEQDAAGKARIANRHPSHLPLLPAPSSSEDKGEDEGEDGSFIYPDHFFVNGAKPA